jgi:hypothetical protein
MTALRVVQWATGNIGLRSLRHVIEHPEMELVGLYVTSPGKVGQDAGELTGLAPTGVKATSDVGEILALNADCVLYMGANCDYDQICAILSSGTNIVTTRGEFHHPGSLPAAERERVEEACAKGGTSIHSTGSSPGFITEAVPLVLASIQRQLDSITIYEYADLASRNSPEMLFDLMGFGHRPEEFPPERFAYAAHLSGPSLRVLADAVGLPLDSVTSTGEVAVTPVPLTIAAGTLEAGTVAAQRTVITGSRNGKPLMTRIATWYCTEHTEPAWTVPGWDGWQVQLRGDCPLDVDIKFSIPEGQMGEMTPGYTANPAVNAVPYVVAAAPGIRPSSDLPPVIPVLGGAA